jgi:hypothetical protein
MVTKGRMADGSGAGGARVLGGLAVLLAVLAPVGELGAQTDYFNLDRNRPARIEDAYATERYAFELKIAPLRLEREADGAYHWGFDPEIAYGILPRTHVEVGFPYAVIDQGAGGRRSGLAGIELSALHNLNTETRGLPALGIRGDVLFPVGNLSSDRIHPSATALLTRTFGWGRVHGNAQYTFGEGPSEGASEPAAEEVGRWLAGVAIDRAFPLNALLLVGDVYAVQPFHEEEDLEWNAGLGFRYQVNPYLAVDAGAGRRLTGGGAWYVTFGSAMAFGFRPFMPVPR